MIPWHQYLFAILFILAGVNHFNKPHIYERIIPPYIPAPKTMNILSGILEMLFGIMLLIPDYQTFAAWGIIVLLIAFFSVHFYMLTNKKASFKLPKWLLIARIPLQFLLIYWAFMYV